MRLLLLLLLAGCSPRQEVVREYITYVLIQPCRYELVALNLCKHAGIHEDE